MNKLIILAFAAMFASNVDACTGVKLTAQDGTQVNGRTLEFGIPIKTSAAVIPKGYQFKGATPKGPGLTYKAKYAVVGAIAYDYPAVLDGMNEKGLVVGTFYFPGYASYTPTTTDNQAKSLSPVDFPNWILTQFATIDEIRTALANVAIAPTVDPAWGETPPPFHYIVYDKNGDSIVIEPLHETLVVYHNRIGVLTNSPTFDWHLTNLRNYVHLNPENAKPIDDHGLEIAGLGQGSGMLGLPGDFTPPARFIRATAFSYTALPPKNSDEGVYQTFHILNQFDIPLGVVRQTEGDKTAMELTLVTSVKDPNTLKYYFKTYDDQSIKFIDLSKFDLNAKEIKQIATTSKGSAIDISSQLK